ncbi:MAG: class I SAM-dependent methyltransferase [Gaiellales bacterium]
MHLAALEGRPSIGTIERDDGFVEVTDIGFHFAPFRRWPAHERRAMRFVRGRVLDVGCGAGRVCLHVQDRGLDVVGVDVSPASIEVCSRRGVTDARVCAIEDVGRRLGSFDTVVMYGNNLSLLGSEKARLLLRRLHAMTSGRGRIVGSTFDPYGETDPAHVAYHERNRRRGRPGGQLRVHIRYRDLCSPWLYLLFTSASELESIIEGTGWALARVIDGGGSYVAVLEKD